MADPSLSVVVAARFSEVLCVGALPPPAGSKTRTRGSGDQREDKNETKRSHGSLLLLGNLLAGSAGRQVEMLRLHEFVHGFINFQFTKGALL